MNNSKKVASRSAAKSESVEIEQYYAVPPESLNIILVELREAKQEFLSAADGGRSGVIRTLWAMDALLRCFEDVKDEGLTTPVAVLLGAIASLERGKIHPLLRPKSVSHRAKSTTIRQGIQAMSVFVVETLPLIGLTKTESKRRVSALLNKHQFFMADELIVKSRTLEGWQSKAHSDVKCVTTLGQAYRSYLQMQPIFVRKKPHTTSIKVLMDGLEGLLINFRAADAI